MELATYCVRDATAANVPRGDLDSESTLVLHFGGSPELAAELARRYPRAHRLGCSTAGEIHGRTVLDQSAVVAVARFVRTTLRSTSVSVSGQADSRAAGRRIATRLLTPSLRAIFVLCDGLAINGSELVRGINEVVPPSVVVTGGLAGDGARFERTWVADGDGVHGGRVVAVGFSGNDLLVGHGSRGGWDIFGPERRVTRADGNVVYELDGKPALALYRQYLGDLAAQLPAAALLFPLAVRTTASDPKQLVRSVLSIDNDKQALVFAGDVPTGAIAQLMSANFDRIVGAACDAAHAAGAPPQGPLLAVAISCVGRRLVLGERTEEEVEAVRSTLSPEAELVGFYSYGEISPYASGACDLHNQTMTLTTLTERQ